MQRLVCVSDIHLSDEFQGGVASDFFGRFLSALNEDGDTDHLIIAGDFIGTHDDPADTSDFETLRRLLRRHDWYDGFKTSVVPGNHDVRIAGVSRHPIGTGIFRDPGAERRNVYRIFRKLFGGPMLETPSYFPFVKQFREFNLIGLDSSSGMPQHTVHWGRLGDEQLVELERLLVDPRILAKPTVIFLHHPPCKTKTGWQRIPPFKGFNNLRDHVDFWSIVNGDNVDLVVCGHEHESYEDERNDVPYVCVGGFMYDDDHALVVDVEDGKLDWSWWNWADRT